MEDTLRSERREETFPGQLILLAGLGALLSGAVLLLAVLFLDRKTAQVVIFSISPLALIPVFTIFYRLHAPSAPLLNKLVLAIAWVGIAPTLIVTFLAAIQRLTGSFLLPSGTFSSSLLQIGGATGMLGIWMILSGYLSIQVKSLPPILAITGMVTGFFRIIIIAGVLLSSFNSWPQLSLSAVWNACLLLWILSYLVWTFWLGGWFLTKKSAATTG